MNSHYQVADVLDAGNAQDIIQGAKVVGPDEVSGNFTSLEIDQDE